MDSKITTHYKIVLIGDSGIGKTTYMKRLCTGEFEKKYVPTVRYELHTLEFNTNYGKVCFDVRDFSGQEKLVESRDDHYQEAHGVIFMFDVTSTQTYMNMLKWVNSFFKFKTKTPVVLCGNKVDIKERKVKFRQIHLHTLLGYMLEKNVYYYDLSAKSNYNFEEPFLRLLREITGKEDLILWDKEPLSPPKISNKYIKT